MLAGPGLLLSITHTLLWRLGSGRRGGGGFVYNLERTLFAQVLSPDNRLCVRGGEGGVDVSTLLCIDSKRGEKRGVIQNK